MEFPEELKYTEEHEWVMVEEELAVIGITDFAQDALGDVVFVELPEEGTEVVAGKAFGVVESVKAVAEVYSPCDGEVIAVNEDLEDEAEQVNSAPYEAWLVKLRVEDAGALEQLLTPAAYAAKVESA